MHPFVLRLLEPRAFHALSAVFPGLRFANMTEHCQCAYPDQAIREIVRCEAQRPSVATAKTGGRDVT